MAINITYDKTLHLLVCTIEGYIEVIDYEQAVHDILHSDEFPQDVPTLWDLRDMAFDNIDFAFQEKLVKVREQIHAQRGQAKIALVSDNALAEPLVKLYSILAKDLNKNTKTFTGIEQAKSWLLF